jgi:CBS domain-containing protein
MTRDPVRVGPDELLERAAHLMAKRRIKRLPVVDPEDKLLGIVSRVDVLRTMGEDYHAPASFEGSDLGRVAHTVADIMRREVPRVRADAHLGEVLDAVTSTRLNRAVVVDSDGRVVGIVADSDLLARLDRGRLAGESSLRASDVMHIRPLTLPADTALTDAAQRMLEARHRVLPITDQQGHLLGVVDRADLLRAMRSSSSTA